MSNMLKLGTAIISVMGLSAITYRYNQKAYRVGCVLWRGVRDSVRNIRKNGPDFTGKDRIFRLSENEQAHEAD